MKEAQKVLGIVGSYRKDGMVDKAVSAILTAAEKEGSAVEKVYLVDHNIEYCTNCRVCMQEPGEERGKCVLEDDMETLLQRIEDAPRLVIGAPVNFDNVTAITRVFMERCVGYAYWPWEHERPQIRNRRVRKKAVLVSASGAPLKLGSKFRQAAHALEYLADLLGAYPIGEVWVDQVNKPEMPLSDKLLRKAERLGRKLAH